MPDEPASPAVELAGAERKLLELLRSTDGPLAEELLAERSGLPPEAVRGSLQRLRAKRLALSEEERWERPRLTERGLSALAQGLPERRLLAALDASGGSLDAERLEALPFEPEERSAAIGILRRRGVLGPGVPLVRKDPGGLVDLPEEGALQKLREGNSEVGGELLRGLRKRGLVEVDSSTRRRWSVSDEGRTVPLGAGDDAIGALTPELLRSGAWRTRSLRAYDVRAPVPRWSGARPHPYRAWLDGFEELLVGLGFSESEGPLVESEFWNSDVLFMPQEHPARSIHDVLGVRGITGRGPPADLLERVAAVHEGRPIPGTDRAVSPGWQGPYDRAVAARPVLRSQTTAVSARFLASHPRPPFRMYCLDRNFRRDAVDATHHVEFGQCEGILGEAGTSLRDLLGVFRALAEGIGIRELKFRPSYFPFTEPSVEGYVRHPRLGWIEVFPGGMFRPEVLVPLGIDVPVAAWGIGVTRLAMVSLGVSDIRGLFLDDLDRLRRGGS